MWSIPKVYAIDEKMEKQIRKDFAKAGKLPKILIVTEKLLTGYDAPVLYAMYLDKPIHRCPSRSAYNTSGIAIWNSYRAMPSPRQCSWPAPIPPVILMNARLICAQRELRFMRNGTILKHGRRTGGPFLAPANGRRLWP